MAAYVKYLLIWINIGSMAGYRYYVMDGLCGSVLSLDTERTYGVILSMNLTATSPSQGQCVVSLVRSSSRFSHLHFYLENFLTDVTSCSKYSLTVADGDSVNTTVQRSEICDTSQNGVSRTSWRTYLQFTFSWNTTLPQVYFLIVVNAYSPDACRDDDSSQTECDNNRCIPSVLKCQVRNPCGDNSDCEKDDDELSYTVRILYTVGSVIVFIFLMAVVYNVCFKTKWSEQCKCEDGCCCKDLCACACVLLRDCFGACCSSIKRSGSKLKGCCCGMCCKNTVSTDRASVVTQPVDRSTHDVPGGMDPPPYSNRAFSPPPTYSVAMRDAPPPEYSEVFSISIDPTTEPPPSYEVITRDDAQSERPS